MKCRKDGHQRRKNQTSSRRDGNLRPEEYTPLNDSLEYIYLATQETERYNKPP